MGGTYVGVATSTVIDLEAVTSIYKIALGPEDCGPNWYHAARGDISRNSITEAFLAGDWEWCLYLDGDMVFPPDLLHRLKAHKKPFVGGLYFRRGVDPIWPLAFEHSEPPVLPFVPMFEYPKEGLVRVNGTGSGCWLVHRDVFGPVQAEMKRSIKAKLDMDVDYIAYLMDGPMPEIRDDYQRVGADLRFCFYARRAGFDIWLDCGLDIGHMSHVPIRREDYDTQGRALYLDAVQGVYGSTAQAYGRQRMDHKSLELKLKQAETHLANITEQVEREKAIQQESQQRLAALGQRGNATKGYIQGIQDAMKLLADSDG
uniref:Uncharacterized protein n=1 Tax=viral metagenome TaxID=1070528 RepID=A0A6M3KPP5_9ZZZZ